MDKSTSVFGALEAHKLPTQAQTYSWIDWLVAQIDEVSRQAPGRSQLSSHGQKLAADVKDLLLAYKQLGEHKNGDDQLQEALWNLTRGQVNVKAEDTAKNEAVTDAQRVSEALQNMLRVFWAHFISFNDGGELASLVRNVLADTAEVVERKAGSAKVQLRETDEEVQRGERDSLGREHGKDAEQDARQRFEDTMDTAKTTGSQAIGAGQSVKQGVDEISEKSSRTFGEVLDNVLEHAQTDEAYRESVTTVLDLASKWYNKAVDSADQKSIDDVIDDPSGRIPAALSSINILLERLAGGKSTRDLTHAFRTTAEDVREDPDLRTFFDHANDFIQRTLREPKYARSEEHGRRRAQLRERWQQLQNGDNRKKWHDDLDKLRYEASEYIQRIEQDRDVQNLRNAYVALSKDSADTAGKVNEVAMGNANWIWQDAMDVVLPKVLESIKNLPIPRTEFKDAEVEFVIEDLNISSLRLLPGRAHIRNTTDMDVSKESTDTDAATQIKSQTQVRFKGVQFKAKDVSFWYRDKSMKPVTEVSGLLGISIPEQGVDVDVILSYVPQPNQKARNSNRHAFVDVERVNVTLNNPQIALKKSNHPILLTAFKPMFRSRLEHSIEVSLEQQIATAIRFMDGVAYDVHIRAGVFRDTGMAPSAAYTSAIWSEIGHLKNQPGPLSGLQTTSVGVVRDDPRTNAKFAIGTQPQIISGEKHGPEVPGSNAQQKRQQAARVAEQSNGQEDEGGKREVQVAGNENAVTSFSEEVRVKKERETAVEGWKSAAFDAPQ